MRIYIMIALSLIICGCNNAKSESETIRDANYLRVKPADTNPIQPSVLTPVEIKKEYIASAVHIGWHKKDPIYIKDFIKNPDKYKNKRVKIIVEVTDIAEKDNKTTMNVILTAKHDPGLVYYDGSLKIYDKDIIEVYGDVYGRYEGQNRMGASMSWPTIIAKYVKKLGTENSE